MQIISLPNGESLIGLTLDEYNEFLIMKGKYEELKNQKQLFDTKYVPINFQPTKDYESYKITCSQ